MSNDKKSERELMIVKFYRQLFVEKILDPIQKNEFFLVRPSPSSLGEILESFSFEELMERKTVIQALVAEILRIFEGEQGLRLFNACQTLSVLFHYTSKKCENVAQLQCLLLPGLPRDFSMIFSQRLRDVIVGDSCLTLKITMLNTLTSLWISFKKCENDLFFFMSNDDSFDSLMAIFSYADLKPLQLTALPLFVVLLRSRGEQQSRFLTRFISLEDNIGVIGIGSFIREQLDVHIDKFVKDNIGEPGNVLSFVSSKVFDLFGMDQAPMKAGKSQHLCLLLFLYMAVKSNRNFAIMLTSPPQSSSPNVFHDGNSTTSPNSNTFSLFLSFVSFIFSDFNRENQKTHAKLCLLILWHIADEPYVQSAMQDVHLANRISLYKPSMLHRAASFEPISPNPTTLSTALLELLTDFNATHLMQQFPFSHYHLSLAIIHRVLIYHKKCRIGLQSWRPLFKSLVSIINFLTQNGKKMVVDDTFGLLHRALLVVNFFITYGDTFLPDAAAYDFLYYEISRQSSVFTKLQAITSEKIESPDFSESKGILDKVNNQLINILSIVEHIRPKLEILAHSYPSEEQVISIVQGCFQDLTLKLYEGLEFVDQPEDFREKELLDAMVGIFLRS
ncbi:hypothetical protein FO519_001418 [Halicephalobus sp. NKZ332]|nr:hypothetical protein FO519_001418 [Halicephalobus sp. NKZ332]